MPNLGDRIIALIDGVPAKTIEEARTKKIFLLEKDERGNYTLRKQKVFAVEVDGICHLEYDTRKEKTEIIRKDLLKRGLYGANAAHIESSFENRDKNIGGMVYQPIQLLGTEVRR